MSKSGIEIKFKANITFHPDGNVHTMPIDNKKHLESYSCWCDPELVGDYTNQGGVKHYLHKELQ